MSLFDYYRNEYLHELSVNGNNVDDNDDFNVDENTDNITVNATANPDSLVTGTGNYPLNKGENTITITVTAEDGSINTYVLFHIQE